MHSYWDCLNDSPGHTISFKLANIHVEEPDNTLQMLQRSCIKILWRQSKIPKFFLQKKILTYDATRSDVFWKVNLKCTKNFKWNAEKNYELLGTWRNPFWTLWTIRKFAFFKLVTIQINRYTYPSFISFNYYNPYFYFYVV